MTFRVSHEILAGDGPGPFRTVYFVHGILGSRRNWRTFARRWVASVPGWRAVIIDLRHHGDSLGAPPPHTIAACAADLAALADEIGDPEVLSGHSFGGKVALTFARDFPDRVQDVWLLDSPPGAVSREMTDPSASEVGRIIRFASEVELPVERRETVAAALVEAGFSPAIAGWMSTNLRRDADRGGFVWRFDLDGVRALLVDYWDLDLWSVAEGNEAGPRQFHVRAADSDRWSDGDADRLRRLEGNSRCLRIESAGHWLHIDAPRGLLEMMSDEL